MADPIRKDLLAQHWVHSHEEDNDSEMVFRPANHKFPPSRGRASFELRPDGSLLEGNPGPGDRNEKREGKWKLDNDRNLMLYDAGPGIKPSRVLKLANVDANRLVVKK
jgi:hypothetical protein